MDPIVAHLLEDRGLTVPDEDQTALEEHWRRLRAQRADVDEHLLADFDIPLVFPAQGHDDE